MDHSKEIDTKRYWMGFDSNSIFIWYHHFDRVDDETIMAMSMDDKFEEFKYLKFEEADRLGYRYNIKPIDKCLTIKPESLISELIMLSRYGIKGEVEIVDDNMNGWYLVLDGKGKVKVYEGRFTYPKKPTLVMNK